MNRKYAKTLIPALLLPLVIAGCEKTQGDTAETASSAAPENAIVISDIEIVPREASMDFPNDMIDWEARMIFQTKDFNRAGKSYAEIGAVNQYATIVSSKEHNIKLLLDSEKPDAKVADILRIDFTGKGDFTNCPATKIKPDMPESEIIKTAVKTAINKIPATLNVAGKYRDYRSWGNEYRTITFGLFSSLQGKCTIDGKQYKIVFTDRGCNLQYNDKPKINFEGRPYIGVADTFAVYEIDASGQATSTPIAETFCGSPVQIGDKCYDIDYSSKKRTISLWPNDSKLTKVSIKTPNAKAMLSSISRKNPRIMAYCNGDADSVLHPGAYKLHKYEITKDNWHIIGDYRGSSKVFNIKADQENALSFALPLKPVVSVQKSSNRRYQLSPTLFDADNREVQIYHGQARATLRFAIKDSEGKTIHAGQFEYG